MSVRTCSWRFGADFSKMLLILLIYFLCLSQSYTDIASVFVLVTVLIKLTLVQRLKSLSHASLKTTNNLAFC